MKRFSRYLVVTLLATGMVVDAAAARRLFRQSCCCRKCPSACTMVCCQECPAPDPCSPCISPCSSAETVVSNSPCQGCRVDSEPQIVTEAPDIPPTPPVESHVPAPSEPAELPVSANDPPVITPAPLGVPEQSEQNVIEAPAPKIEAEPAQSIVGDRYSDEGGLFGSPSAEESIAPKPTTEPSSEPAANVDSDIFGEPITPPSSDPQPAQESLPPSEPEPEPGHAPEADVDDVDIFGSAKSPEEPVSDDPVPEEENDVPVDQTPASEVSPPEESAPAESEPSDPDEDTYDPFGEMAPTSDLEVTMLQRAGGLLSDLERTWTDDTATFECQARLVRVTSNHITLQRPEGTTIQVALSRLATTDLQFVRQQITALRIVRARDAAAEKLAVAWDN